MAWRMLSRALSFISIIVLAGVLVPKDFGIVALATSVTASIDSLSQLGVRDALIRLRDDRRDYYDAAFSLQAARGVLTGSLILIFAEFADAWLGEPRLKAVLLVLAATTVIGGFENIGIVTFSRALDFRTQFALQAGPRILGFLVTTSLAILMKSYWALVIGAAVSKIAGVAATYLFSPYRPRFGATGWRYLLGFSFWSWAGGLAIVVWSRSDAFLLGPVLGITILGIYMIAGEIAILPVTELIEPASAVLFPGFALARRSGSNTVGMGLSIAGSLALCAIPFSIGISACSGYLVSCLLGAKWEAAQPIIATLAWLCMFSPFSYVCASVLSSNGAVRRVFASNAIAAAVKVATVLAVRDTGNLILIAVTAVATVAFESVIFIWQLQTVGNRELSQLAKTMFRAAVSTAVTCSCLYFLPGTWEHISENRALSGAIGAAIGATTFLIFGSCQATLWVLAGRPSGAEARISDTVYSRIRESEVFRNRGGWFRILRQ